MSRRDEIKAKLDKYKGKKIPVGDIHRLLQRMGVSNIYKRKEYIEWLIAIKKIGAVKSTGTATIFEVFGHDDSLE